MMEYVAKVCWTTKLMLVWRGTSWLSIVGGVVSSRYVVAIWTGLKLRRIVVILYHCTPFYKHVPSLTASSTAPSSLPSSPSPGAATGWHLHGWPYFVVMIIGGILRVHDGTTVSETDLAQGQAYNRPSGIEHDVMNGSPHPIAFVEIEIKRPPVFG